MEQQSSFTDSGTCCAFDSFLTAWIEMDEVAATIILDNHD
jgi:hypothetical protein